MNFELLLWVSSLPIENIIFRQTFVNCVLSIYPHSRSICNHHGAITFRSTSEIGITDLRLDGPLDHDDDTPEVRAHPGQSFKSTISYYIDMSQTLGVTNLSIYLAGKRISICAVRTPRCTILICIDCQRRRAEIMCKWMSEWANGYGYTHTAWVWVWKACNANVIAIFMRQPNRTRGTTTCNCNCYCDYNVVLVESDYNITFV